MGNFIVSMINLLIKGLGGVLGLIFMLLPPSPFKLIDNSPIAPYITGLNWIIPVNEIILISEAWLTAIGIFYLQQIVLRWAKAIE